MIKYGPGTKVEVVVVRDRQEKTFSLTAKEPPVQASMLDQQRRSRPEIDIGDFPGFKDFPRVPNADQMPNRTGNARLGVEVGDVNETARKTYGIDQSTSGAVVNSVVPTSVADRLGLKVGDVVTEIDGKRITSAAELADAVRKIKWGDTKRVKYVRFESGSRQDYDREVTFR
jgi:S1-C subfamily serine protease